MHTKTTRARGKVREQYRWAYATSTLISLQENGQNQHEKGGWAFNTSWAYNTYLRYIYIIICDRHCTSNIAINISIFHLGLIYGLISAFFPVGTLFGTSRPNTLAWGHGYQSGVIPLWRHYRPPEQTRSELWTTLFSPARSSLTSRVPTCYTPLVNPIHGFIAAFFPVGRLYSGQADISIGARVSVRVIWSTVTTLN